MTAVDPFLTVARAVVDRRALVTASHETGLTVDFALVMDGFDFETVWQERRTFVAKARWSRRVHLRELDTCYTLTV